MKNILLIFAAIMFTLTGNVQVMGQGCTSCDPNNPDFVLFLETSVSPPANGPGGFGTTQAQISVSLRNNTGATLNLRTIEYSMGLNSNTLTSVTNITSDATNTTSFPNSQVFNPFPPPGSFVTIIDVYPPSAHNRMVGANSYDQHYEYDHTSSGAMFPPQMLPAGANTQIITVFFTLDGSQTFTNDPMDPNYFGDPAYLIGYPGDCITNDPNVNNQFGFQDNAGNPVLNNCYAAITGPPSANLPIELTVFEGEIHDNFNKLKWETQVEINTKYHHIERSIDPATDAFRVIGTVDAAGNSENANYYSLNDDDPPTLAYYRLKTEDGDGSIQYSEVIVLKRSSKFDFLSVYPNPTVDRFEIQYSVDSESDVKIDIIDVLGRIMESHLFTDPEGVIKKEFDLGNYADGVYFIRLSNGIKTKTKEVIKSRP